jgi:glycosyltransferase involved in cell wall biosynthesis
VIVGIDASNIRGGGGVTHLAELLRAADPARNRFSKLIVWSGARTLAQLQEQPWVIKAHEAVLDRGVLQRAFWQRYRLSRRAREADCDVLFVPGGSFAGDFRPIVTMSRNLLPFEWRELRRFGVSAIALKLLVLRFTQTRTLRAADGVAFLTRYAEDVVMRIVRRAAGRMTVIPHGIDARFLRAPREQLPLEAYSATRPLRIVYVSIVDEYKHQWQVAAAVARLRAAGWPVMLELIGPARASALRRLRAALRLADPAGEFIRYIGPVRHEDLHRRYFEQDLCVFASSCENMPNILLEGMACGLPIACSNRGPMPEVLGDAGVYFDPEDPEDIARALRQLIGSPVLRASLAAASFARAQSYSWRRCADETFEFLAAVAHAGGARH